MTENPLERGAKLSIARFEEVFDRLATNLLSLEINTVLKDNILATVVPRTGHALIDILKDYEIELTRIEGVLTRAAANPETAAAPKSEAPISASHSVADYESFDALRTRARAVYHDPRWALLGEERTGLLQMVCRIRDNADEIKDILTKVTERGNSKPRFTRAEVAPIRLLPEETLAIRKIWEIGTEVIEMQTVVQLDGDVVTRLRPARALVQNDPLLAVHNQAVMTSVGTWNRLVDTLANFARTLLSLFSGKPAGGA